MATKKKAKFEDSFKARVIVEDEEYVNICGHTVGTSASILKKITTDTLKIVEASHAGMRGKDTPVFFTYIAEKDTVTLAYSLHDISKNALVFTLEQIRTELKRRKKNAT